MVIFMLLLNSLICKKLCYHPHDCALFSDILKSANIMAILKVCSHGVVAAAIFLPQQMGYIGFNVSVHTAAAVATMPQVNGSGTHFVWLWQQHYEGSPDSGMLK